MTLTWDDEIRSMIAQLRAAPGPQLPGQIGRAFELLLDRAVAAEQECARLRAEVAYAAAIVSGDARWEASVQLREVRAELAAAQQRIAKVREHCRQTMREKAAADFGIVVQAVAAMDVTVNAFEVYEMLTLAALDEKGQK